MFDVRCFRKSEALTPQPLSHPMGEGGRQLIFDTSPNPLPDRGGEGIYTPSGT
jgi:hypothetical protein